MKVRMKFIAKKWPSRRIERVARCPLSGLFRFRLQFTRGLPPRGCRVW